MRVRVGTSGYAYKEWQGAFYPEKTKEKDRLRLYAERLATVEIKTTCYRMPSTETLARWRAQLGDGSLCVLEASQRITHRLRLSPESKETVDLLFETARALGDRLGPVFFQTPPLFKKDAPRLREFLAALPPSHPVAFEFRHETWFDDEVYDALRTRNASLVAADKDDAGDEGTPIVPTADWGYLRLRRCDYDEASLAAWRERILAQGWREAYVFFKHEEGVPLRWPLIERFAHDFAG
jgi:uncharacterized protein YecE (DUF72 family)